MTQKQSFGEVIKVLRKAKKLSQKDLCEGICSQPMLSSIESGKYVPNSKLLIQLCQKLEVSIDTIILNDHYEISEEKDFSKQAEQLCNNHQYKELKVFLRQPEVENSIQSSRQLQAYYYYLGCSSFHLDKELQECKQNLKLSIAEAASFTKADSLTRLGLASLAMVNAKQLRKSSCKKYIEQSLQGIYEVYYEPNLNIIFYLNGLALFELEEYEEAALMIDAGIAFVVKHDSHFMLANLFYLLAVISQKTEDLMGNKSAAAKSRLFEELYHESVFKKI
ncbi:helix-turn-helix domain-containing protein [Enterococcus sp. AZ109]|uniref:helix-turn-helix domain-containing protein n=1 Tax=Enterococcus sp. AZ109 TaxID=2774634 RepID=UPI003F2923A4